MADIIIGFSKEEDGNRFKSVLMRHGYRVAGVYRAGANILNAAEQLQSGIIVCGYKLTDMLYSELHENMPDGFQMIVIAKPDLRFEEDSSSIIYEPTPISVGHLCSTIEMIVATTSKRHRDRHGPRVRTAEEKIIRKAKNLLMVKNDMNESDAHHYIQKKSMESGDSLVETAEKILVIYG